MCIFIELNNKLVALFNYATVPSKIKILRTDNNLPHNTVPQKLILHIDGT